MTWQEKLDETFPWGGSVTQVEDVVEGIGFDQSPNFLTLGLTVLEEAEKPTVQLYAFGVQKEVTFQLEELTEVSPGAWLVKTVGEDEPDFIISLNVAPEVRNDLRKARRGDA